MSDRSKTISVVVPVYNVDAYLSECLDSILAQTYKNYEIIIIDDGSQDNSGGICDEYSTKYPDLIKVIHKKNEGLNIARRDGFLASNGELITFVDSDDLIAPNYLDTLCNTLIDFRVDIVVCGFREFFEARDLRFSKTKRVSPYKSESKDEIFTWLFRDTGPWGDQVYMMTAWGKLYKRSVLEELDWDFSNYRSNEDELWTLQNYNNARMGIAVITSGLYGYRRNQNSITRKKYSNEFEGKKLNKFEFIDELYNKSLSYLGDEYADDLLWRFAVHTSIFIDRYNEDKTLTLDDILSVKSALYPKIDTILGLTLPEEVARKIEFIKHHGIWLYVLSIKFPRIWGLARRMRQVLD